MGIRMSQGAKSHSEAEYDAITDAASALVMRLHAVIAPRVNVRLLRVAHDCDPLHAFEYAAMLEIWDVADHLPRTETTAPARPFKPRSRVRTYAVAAAICLAALPLAAFTGWEAGWLPSSYERFDAANGLRQVTLAMAPSGTQHGTDWSTAITRTAGSR